jgi:WD40 repeat protein
LGTVETPAAIHAVILVPHQGEQVVVAGADHIIRSGALPAVAAPDQAASPAPTLKEFKGHSGPVTALAAMPNNPAQFVSGGEDGTVRVWSVESGGQVQEAKHGGPVSQVAVRKDGQRIASVSSNHTAKLWNGSLQPVAEIKGDFRTPIRGEGLQRAVAIAKRHVDGANGDLKQGKDRKTAEDKNVTSAEEGHKKAADEFAKKAEAAKKPVEEKQAADKALEEAKTAVAQREEGKKSAEAAIALAETSLVKAKTETEAATKQLGDADAGLKQTLAQLEKVKAAVEKQLADAELAVKEAQTRQKNASVEKIAKEKLATDAEAAKKSAEAAKLKADSELAAAQESAKQAEQKANQLKDPAQKATDEKNTAEKTMQSAMRSLERAKESATKATNEIPGLEMAVKLAEERQKQAETTVQQAAQEASALEKPIRSVSFSPDGLVLATGGDDQIVHTWDAETGAGIDTFAGHDSPVVALAFTASGDVLSVAANRTAFVWDTNPPWQLIRTIGSPDNGDVFVDRVTALDFSPDGSLLATGGGEPSRSGQLKIFRVEDGQLVKELPDAHSDVIYGLEFSPDGKQIASCGADRFAKVFDIDAGKLVRGFEGHTHHVLGVSWRADGRLLVTSGADSVIKVWDARTGDQQRTIQGFGKEVTAIRFVAESDNVLASCGDATVKMKNSANGRDVRDFGGSGDFVHGCSISANGKLIVAGGQDSVLRAWTDDGKEYAKFDAPKPAASK